MLTPTHPPPPPLADNNCHNQAYQTTINGQMASLAYDSYSVNGVSYSVFRATRLKLNNNMVANSVMCFTLDTKGSCYDLDNFCYGGGGSCEYSLFNGASVDGSTGYGQCCPVGRLSNIPSS